MCKSLTTTFTCTHTLTTRLSTCRGTFKKFSRKLGAVRPVCQSAPQLAMKSRQACGDCQRGAAERELEERFTRKRLEAVAVEQGSSSGVCGGWGVDGVVDAEGVVDEVGEEYQRESWALKKRYPGPRFEKFARPEQGRVLTRTGKSPLQVELRPENIPDGGGWSSTWDSAWDSNWKTMDEEMAESEAEKSEGLREYEALMAETYEAWLADADADADMGAETEDGVAATGCEGVESWRVNADIEALPEKVSSTLVAHVEPENVQPNAACLRESRRCSAPERVRCRLRSGSDGGNDSGFTCLPPWLLVES